jgi:hypothetical protein
MILQHIFICEDAISLISGNAIKLLIVLYADMLIYARFSKKLR